jgi:ornithine cyclodeaminase
MEEVFQASRLTSIATTALEPHVSDLSGCAAGSTLLHISLRDLMPAAILACDNVVDDIDHVCRAGTSLHVAEQTASHRRFIRCTLADVFTGVASPRSNDNGITVFSPFGLGILDLAVGALVRKLCVEQNQGTVLTSFLPDSWLDS